MATGILDPTNPALETKPGVYTTEFWTMIVVNLINFLNLINVWSFVPNRVSVVVMSVVTGLYSVARGVAKSGVKPGAPAPGVPVITNPTTPTT